MVDQAPATEMRCHLLYDGACPVCSSFARVADAAEAGQMTKVDARNDSILRQQATAAGMDLDYGIVVEHAGKLYYGPDALTYLAGRQRSSGWSLIYLPFRSRAAAHILYPFLVRLRWLLLWLTRKSFIRNLPNSSP
jgi:predicted DCC family thiol-disulfide oxidoreductase YuxK